MAETLKIKDLPLESRPREAFMRSANPQKEMSDATLLAILIRTGQKGSSAIDLANRLIKHFGSAAELVNYLYANQIIRDIQEYTIQRITRNYLYRRVIAPLRDEGVIIASSSHGYKIPISVDDIKTYLNSTHTVVSPMLHRIGICRNLILQQTGNHLDVLDDPAFLRYKKYFD